MPSPALITLTATNTFGLVTLPPRPLEGATHTTHRKEHGRFSSSQSRFVRSGRTRQHPQSRRKGPALPHGLRAPEAPQGGRRVAGHRCRAFERAAGQEASFPPPRTGAGSFPSRSRGAGPSPAATGGSAALRSTPTLPDGTGEKEAVASTLPAPRPPRFTDHRGGFDRLPPAGKRSRFFFLTRTNARVRNC